MSELPEPVPYVDPPEPAPSPAPHSPEVQAAIKRIEAKIIAIMKPPVASPPASVEEIARAVANLTDYCRRMRASEDGVHDTAWPHAAAIEALLSDRAAMAERVAGLERLLSEAASNLEERAVVRDMHEAAEAEVARLREALRPFAAVSDAYYASELDEHRPEWVRQHPEDVEVLGGRGGKRLLTLADFHAARAALTRHEPTKET